MNTFLKPLIGLMLLSVGGCMQTATVDPLADSFQQYAQRADKVTLSSGDDQEVNTRVHEKDPWPVYVGNKNIPGDGQRMVGAIERYKTATQDKGPKPLPLERTTDVTSANTQ
jgi:hypothetical protein